MYYLSCSQWLQVTNIELCLLAVAVPCWFFSCSCEERAGTNQDGSLSLEECEELLVSIRDQYPQEYRLYGLSSLAVAVAFPRIKTLLQNWDMLAFPTLHCKVFESWRNLLKGEEVEGDGVPGESRSGLCVVYAYVHTYMALCSGLSSCAWVVLKLCVELLMLVSWLLRLLVSTSFGLVCMATST